MTAQRPTIVLIDEAMRQHGSGLYLLAMVYVAAGDAEDTRAALKSVPRHARPRFHWHDEERRDQLAMIDVLARLGLVTTVVYQTPSPPRKQEQARARCLTVGLCDLEQAGAVRLVLEARQDRLNRRDKRTIAAARRDQLVPASVPFDFVKADDDPLLWAADAMAGAAGAALADDDSRFISRLPDASWTIREVPAP